VRLLYLTTLCTSLHLQSNPPWRGSTLFLLTLMPLSISLSMRLDRPIITLPPSRPPLIPKTLKRNYKYNFNLMPNSRTPHPIALPRHTLLPIQCLLVLFVACVLERLELEDAVEVAAIYPAGGLHGYHPVLKPIYPPLADRQNSSSPSSLRLELPWVGKPPFWGNMIGSWTSFPRNR
jgi:hypothetical protein